MPVLRSSAVLACAVALAAASATPAVAQSAGPGAVRSNTRGLILGVGLNASSISADELDEGTDTGGGLDLTLGWGFTPSFALLLDASGAAMDGEGGSYGMGHFDVAARYSFAKATRAFIPYLEVGFTGRAVGQDDVEFPPGSGTSEELFLSGGGFSFGGGVQYFFIPKLSLGAKLKWTVGEFSRVEYGNVSVDGLEIDATTARLTLGLTWYPLVERGR